MLEDKTKVTGKVVVTLRDSTGKIKDRTCVNNLVVSTGRSHIADQLAGSVQAAMSHMALGEGTTVADYPDTALEAEVAGSRKPFDSKEQGTGADSNKVIYRTEWASGEGEGILTEAGIFNALSSGTMLCRTTFQPKSKGPGDSITLVWTLTITG